MRVLVFIARFALLLVVLAAMVLCVRSCGAGESVCWASLTERGSVWTRATLSHGKLAVVRDRLSLSGINDIPNERLKAALPRGEHSMWDRYASPADILSNQPPSFWNQWGWILHREEESECDGEGAAAVTVRHERRFVGFPIWFVILLAAIMPVGALRGPLRKWRGKRRAAQGRCAKCNYDLRASSERCPECGEMIRTTIEPIHGTRRHPGRLAWGGAALMFAIAFLCGITYHPSQDARWNVPTWFDLGGNVYHAAEAEEASKGVLKFGGPAWFSSFNIPATQIEADARAFRASADTGIPRFKGRLLSMPMAKQPAGNATLPLLPETPMSPEEIPLEDRDVQMSLWLTVGKSPAEVGMVIRMGSRWRDVYREVEHRHTNVLPFLFAIYVDGQPVHRQLASAGKFGGANSMFEWLKGETGREWQFRLDEASLHGFLPDDKPHEMSIIAAFSERQHEQYIPGSTYIDAQKWGAIPPGPQLIIRTRPAKFRWTGTTWEFDRPESP